MDEQTSQLEQAESDSTWLDNWLEQAMGARDAKIRSNAVVALFALGGARRMLQLARLIGSSAVRVKSGDRGAAEVMAVALREAQSGSFSESDRAALLAVLGKDASTLDPQHRSAARAFLLQTQGWIEWLTLRRFMPKPAFLGGFISSLQASASAAVLLCITVWSLMILRTELHPTLAETNKASGVILFFVVVGIICGVIGGYLIAPGVSQPAALAIDAVVASVVPAGLGAAALFLFNQPGWSVSVPDGAWAFYLAFAIPGLALSRAIVWILGRKATALAVAMPALGWPILLVTIIALVLQHEVFELEDFGPTGEAASAAWVAFVISVSAFAISVARTESELYLISRPVRAGRLQKVTENGAAALSTVLLLLILSAFVFASPPKFQTAYRISSSDEFKVLEDIPKGALVTLSAPEGAFMKITTIATLFQDEIIVNNGGQSLESFARRRNRATPNAGLFRTPAPAVVTVSHVRKKALEICIVDRFVPSRIGETGCGAKNMGPSVWLPSLVGQTEQASDDKTDLFVLQFKPAPTRPIESLSLPAKLEPRRNEAVYTFSLKEQASLSANVPSDDVRDRLFVLEQVLDDGTNEVIFVVDPKDDLARTLLSSIPFRAGQYRLCVRVYNAFVQDCDGPIHEILPVTIELKAAEPEKRS